MFQSGQALPEAKSCHRSGHAAVGTDFVKKIQTVCTRRYLAADALEVRARDQQRGGKLVAHFFLNRIMQRQTDYALGRNFIQVIEERVPEFVRQSESPTSFVLFGGEGTAEADQETRRAGFEPRLAWQMLIEAYDCGLPCDQHRAKVDWGGHLPRVLQQLACGPLSPCQRAVQPKCASQPTEDGMTLERPVHARSFAYATYQLAKVGILCARYARELV
jgi:hypothetical protein